MIAQEATTSFEAFPVLSERLTEEVDRLGRVLRAIHASIGKDLAQLDLARQKGDASLARDVAQRAAAACRVLGESATCALLMAVGNAQASVLDPALGQRMDCARAGLADVIERLAPLVATRDRLTGPSEDPKDG